MTPISINCDSNNSKIKKNNLFILLLTPENPFTNYQTATHRPIAQHISEPNVSGNSQQIPNWSIPGNQHFQARTEIQTETNLFDNIFNLQTTNKSSIKFLL